MASAFAGVAAGMGVETNALTIRGNAPKGVQWRLEGVEIPNPNHFAGLNVAGGGGVTLFSSQLLDDSDFLTGAFPAEYGNALAGVFDMRFRSGNPTRREHTFQAGVLGIELASEGPFDRDGATAYLFNYRYSTLGLLLPLLPTEDVARYQDLSFNLSFPTRRWGRFEVWGLGGLDGQTMTEEPDSSQWEYETWDRLDTDLRLGVGATGLNHHLAVGPRSYLRTTAALTLNRTRWDQRRLSDDLVLEDNLFVRKTNRRAILSTSLNHTFGARYVNRTGVTVQQLRYDLDLRAAPDDAPPVVPIAQGDGQSTLLQLYTQSQLDLTPRLTLGAGLHVPYFALTEATSVEPRVSLRWQLADGQALSLGYGLHSQIEDLRIYFARPGTPDDPAMPNRDLDLAKAHHGVLGYDRRLGTSARLKLDVYVQSLFDVPVIADSSYSMLNFEQDWEFREPLAGTGAGRNYGVELTVERFFDDGYYVLVTGALFRARYRGGDGVWRDTRFDRRFTANALFGREFALGDRGTLLGVNGRLSLLGGTRYSPVDHAASRAQEEIVFDETRAFARQKPNLFLVDLTVTYRRNHDRFSSVWALQVKNALAAQETLLDYNFATERVEAVKEGFPLPVLSYKIEF